jgi:hypothetical protein
MLSFESEAELETLPAAGKSTMKPKRGLII